MKKKVKKTNKLKTEKIYMPNCGKNLKKKRKTEPENVVEKRKKKKKKKMKDYTNAFISMTFEFGTDACFLMYCFVKIAVDKIIFFPFKSIEEKRRCSLL